MTQTIINFRMDEEVKKQFGKFCAGKGTNMITAFNILQRKQLESTDSR